MTIDAILAGAAAQVSHGMASLALLEAGAGDYGPWGTLIGILKGLLIAAGGLGFMVGLAVKAAAPTSTEAQETGNRFICGSLCGLLFGLLGPVLYTVIVGWTS